MTLRKILFPTQKQQVQTDGQDSPSDDPHTLQEQAAIYGNIARQALADCKKEMSADEALERRRNQSGQ